MKQKKRRQPIVFLEIYHNCYENICYLPNTMTKVILTVLIFAFGMMPLLLARRVSKSSLSATKNTKYIIISYAPRIFPQQHVAYVLIQGVI